MPDPRVLRPRRLAPAGVIATAHLDASALRRVLERVVEQVPDICAQGLLLAPTTIGSIGRLARGTCPSLARTTERRARPRARAPRRSTTRSATELLATRCARASRALRRAREAAALARIFSRNRLRVSAVHAGSSRIVSTKPRIADSGVLSSCETLATKSRRTLELPQLGDVVHDDHRARPARRAPGQARRGAAESGRALASGGRPRVLRACRPPSHGARPRPPRRPSSPRRGGAPPRVAGRDREAGPRRR